MPVPVLTAQSPSPGSISWPAFSIAYAGTSYNVAAFNTNKRFTWWRYNAGAPTLNFGDALPDGRLQQSRMPNDSFGIADTTELSGAEWWGTGWNNDAGYSATPAVNIGQRVPSVNRSGGTSAIKLTTTSASASGSATVGLNGMIPVTAGETIWVELDLTSGDATNPSGIYIRYFDQTGAQHTDLGAEGIAIANGTSGQIVQRSFVVPAGVTNIIPFVLLYAPTAGSGKTLYVESFKVGRVAIQPALTADDLLLFLNKNGVPVNAQNASVLDGSLIVSESIYADAIAANQITGTHILAGEIDTSHLAANSVDTNALQAGSVTADQMAANAIVAGTVAAGAIDGMSITGLSLAIGNITLNPVSGLTVPQPNGGVIQFPTDGSDALVQAKLVATALTVKDNMSIYGTALLNGTMRASAGVPDPSTAPTMTTTWPRVSGTAYLTSYQGYGGMGSDVGGSNFIISGMRVTPIMGTMVAWVTKTTGAQVGSTQLVAAITGDEYQYSWVGAINGALYGISYVPTSSGVTQGWYATPLASTGPGNLTRSGPRVFIAGPTAGAAASEIGTDGTYLLIAESVGNNIQVRKIAPSSGVLNSTVSLGIGFSVAAGTMKHISSASYDFGAQRYLVLANNSVYSFNSSGTLQSSETFPVDPTYTAFDMGWDGTRFWTVDPNGLSKYATGHNTAANIFARYTWYDGNATGSTHETGPSPSAPGFWTFPARSWLMITGSPAPQAGSTGTDDANLLRFYFGASAATTKLQATQPGLNTPSMTYETINTAAGAAPPASSNFGTIGVKGRIESGTLVSGTANWFLSGDGTAKLGGLALTAAGGLTLPDTLNPVGDIALRRNNHALVGVDRGNAVVTLNASGNFTFSFQEAFPSGYGPVVIANGGNGESVYVVPNPTNTGFTAYFYTQAGAVLANATIRCYWVAM